MSQDDPASTAPAPGLRARLTQALELLAGRVSAEGEAYRLERENADLLRASLQTQGEWVREALKELTRLNDLAVAAEGRALTAEASLAQLRREFDAVSARQQAWLDKGTKPMYDALAAVQTLSGRGVPAFVRADARPAFQPHASGRAATVAVVSAPKAGTYLIAEILKALGFQDCGVHGAEWGLADLRWGDRGGLLARLQSLNVVVPLADYIGLVRPGDFMLSHLPPTETAKAALTSTRKIAAVREVRTAFVSFMRYAVQHGLVEGAEEMAALEGPARMAAFARSSGAQSFFDLTRPISDWAGPDVIRVRFEDLTGPDGAQWVEAIAAHVLTIGETADALDMSSLLSTKTLTASGAQTDLSAWWNDDVEAAFVEQGGPEINQSFGYPP